MKSLHSVPWLTATFTVVGRPKIYLRIRRKSSAEKDSEYSTNSSKYERRNKRAL